MQEIRLFDYKESFSILMDVKTEVAKGQVNKNDIQLSIIIPTFSRRGALLEAVDSVLFQDDCGFEYEIIVINNDPNDRMLDIKDKYKDEARVCLFYNSENIGPAANHDRGALLALGKYIMFLHDDDILVRDSLKKWEKYINNDNYKDIDCFYSCYYYTTANKSVISNNTPGHLVQETHIRHIKRISSSLNNKEKIMNKSLYMFLYTIVSPHNLTPGCALYKRDSYLALGGMNPNILIYDLNLFLRALACKEFRMMYVPILSGIYRRTDTSAFVASYQRVSYEIMQNEMWILTDKASPFLLRNAVRIKRFLMVNGYDRDIPKYLQQSLAKKYALHIKANKTTLYYMYRKIMIFLSILLKVKCYRLTISENNISALMQSEYNERHMALDTIVCRQSGGIK
ncbi:hypothetical protein AGMMS49992_23530 [Clostridia bacterium]|nr:hypothetical protein AGMMS49992_23530 [Clostridia bacterium]